MFLFCFLSQLFLKEVGSLTVNAVSILEGGAFQSSFLQTHSAAEAAGQPSATNGFFARASSPPDAA